ncbi:MAG: 1-deoxy-D-xylulose-5-phosphate synthase [FCB group bacterium]|nr:1-deoxy-D-xylulose-5-phosphate synthase [FCB group bacterium]
MGLKNIKSSTDLKKLSVDELLLLAEEIRAEVITTVSKTGGHLASNLGVVEMTLALHYLYDCPDDKIVWDVAHQAYVHKLLTGRHDRFSTMRQYGGLSGFTKRSESDADPFGAGHASTSISAALGLAEARDLLKEKHHVIAVIGDGALTGGLSFEGLNNAGARKKDLLVILNDNTMSISPNVGAMSKYLTNILTDQSYNRLRADVWRFLGRLKRAEKIRSTVANFEAQLKGLLVPGIIFEKLGFRYFGPIDGHDLPLLIKTLGQIKELPGPRMLHMITQKGRGYQPAEKDATHFHGVSAFNKVTGKSTKNGGLPSYTSVFGKKITELAGQDSRLVAITAAMAPGTGLSEFAEKRPNQFFDVGIAEQHAICFAAGLAAGGARPVCAIYSTFLQRAYDQIIHDVALQKLPVIFAIDRGGLVGEDGPTHHGAFDLSYLRSVPNMTVAVPCDGDELEQMLEYAVSHRLGPVAIRYPRGSIPYEFGRYPNRFEWGRWEVIHGGTDLAIIATGSMVTPCRQVVARLKEEGVSASLINGRFVKPLDTETLIEIAERFDRVVSVEENSVAGGFGSGISAYLDSIDYRGRMLTIGIPDRFIQHGSRQLLLKEIGLDVDGLYRSISPILKSKRSFFQALHIRRNGRKITKNDQTEKREEVVVEPTEDLSSDEK